MHLRKDSLFQRSFPVDPKFLGSTATGHAVANRLESRSEVKPSSPVVFAANDHDDSTNGTPLLSAISCCSPNFRQTGSLPAIVHYLESGTIGTDVRRAPRRLFPSRQLYGASSGPRLANPPTGIGLHRDVERESQTISWVANNTRAAAARVFPPTL